jgi:uncharacterized protein YndB with AHSA1/START domain
MSESKPTPEQDVVVVETEIAAPPERVFEALVDQKQLFHWWGQEPSVELTAFEMSPQQGGAWRFTCQERAGHDHGEVGQQLKSTGAKEFVAHGEVLESVPPRLLVWSWIANWHERPEERTIVKWELEPTSVGTRVRVTHSGLANLPAAHKDYSKGWVGVLSILRKFAEELRHGTSDWAV